MSLDLEGIRNKQARRTGRGWQQKEGDNIIRFLPHTSKYFSESVSDIAIQFRSHFLKAEGADIAVIRCPRDRSEQCPFCEAYRKYKESTDPAIKKVVENGGIRSGERHLYNLIDLNNVGGGVQSYESGPRLYDDLLIFFANPAWGDLLSPTEGRNWTLNYRAKGSSGYPEYKVSPHPDKSNISAHLPQDLIVKLDELENMIPSYPEPDAIARWLDIFGMSAGHAAPAAVIPAAVTPAPVIAAPAAAYAPPPSAPIYTPPVAAAAGTPPLYTPPAVTVETLTVGSAGVAVPAAPNATGTSPVAIWCAEVGIPTAVKDNREVPACFSEGLERKDVIGFNPLKYPCDKKCPERSNCQLKQIGL